jgi:hypothetical protein
MTIRRKVIMLYCEIAQSSAPHDEGRCTRVLLLRFAWAALDHGTVLPRAEQSRSDIHESVAS